MMEVFKFLKSQSLLWKENKITDAHMAVQFFVIKHWFKYPHKKILNYIHEQKFCEALYELKFKKVKQKALSSLTHWLEGKWNFVLIDYIPSPYEVLNWQAAGVRPVTCILQEKLSPILNRDDSLEFFLHDLEHGHMFFYHEEKKNMQLEFFNQVKLSLESHLWSPYLEDKNFKEKFFYLISDMNTHKEHYRHYLKAILPSNDFPKFEFLFESK